MIPSFTVRSYYVKGGKLARTVHNVPDYNDAWPIAREAVQTSIHGIGRAVISRQEADGKETRVSTYSVDLDGIVRANVHAN